MSRRRAICEFELIAPDCVRMIATEVGKGIIDITEYPPDPDRAEMFTIFDGHPGGIFDVEIKCPWMVDFGRVKTLKGRMRKVLEAAVRAEDERIPTD